MPSISPHMPKRINEVRLIMAGGGSHWWNYIITEDDCVYVEDSMGRSAQAGHLVINENEEARLVSDDYVLVEGEQVFDYESASIS